MQYPSIAEQPAQRNALPPPGHAYAMLLRAAEARRVSSDTGFLALLAAYRRSGGLARSAEIATLLERQHGIDAATLERWRGEGRVIAFDWQACTWLPRFQFAAAHALPDGDIAAVLAVFAVMYSDWEAACWFARPHPALQHQPPAALMAAHLGPAVLRAARDDRNAFET